jgi:hypothetical protein
VVRIVALALLVTAAAVEAAAALAAQSPKALRAAILAAARAQHSVHYVSKATGAGGSGTIVGDVAAKRGVQRIAFRKGGGSGRATVLVVHRTAYVRGDAFTLRDFFGFSASQSKRYAHRWITIPSTSPAYAGVAAAVTLGSFLTQIIPKTHLVRVSGTVGGRPVVGVRGVARHEGESLVQTVYARAQGTRLPVREMEKGSAGFHGVTSIGPWNRRVHVQAPLRAVTVARVLGH